MAALALSRFLLRGFCFFLMCLKLPELLLAGWYGLLKQSW
jgi:hypothetical protein